MAELRGDAPAARRRHLDGFAAARATADPRAVALALEGLAGAQALVGRFASTARLLGGAGALRAAAGAPQPAAERGDVARSTAAALRGLGAEAFAAECASGAETAPDVLVAEVTTPTEASEGTEAVGESTARTVLGASGRGVAAEGAASYGVPVMPPSTRSSIPLT